MIAAAAAVEVAAVAAAAAAAVFLAAAGLDQPALGARYFRRTEGRNASGRATEMSREAR